MLLFFQEFATNVSFLWLRFAVVVVVVAVVAAVVAVVAAVVVLLRENLVAALKFFLSSFSPDRSLASFKKVIYILLSIHRCQMIAILRFSFV